MELNNFVFPTPTPSYTSTSLNGLIWIPRTRFFSMKSILKDLSVDKKEPNISFENSKIFQIPCFYQKWKQDCKDVILFFHGNAEDLGMCESLGRSLSNMLKANVLMVEYSGYGIYKGNVSTETIIEDAEIVYDFLVNELGLLPENILVIGRSLGSAPALHLASNRELKSVILLSAFTGIKDIVKNNYGSLVSYLVAERFENIEKVKKVSCPLLLIHGKYDELIPPEHSKTLLNHCKSPAKLHISQKMAHNQFDILSDIITPIQMFFDEMEIKLDYTTSLKLPNYVFLNK